MSEDSSKPKKKKKKIFKIIKIFLISLICLIILAGVAGLGVALAMIKTAPALDKSMITSLEQPSAIYDNEGNFMDKVVTGEDRTVVPLDKIPDKLKNAFISIEDERFYEHKGIDPKRIIGVVFIDIKNKLTHKEGLQGASTLTQQLIKKTLLTSEQTLTRKVQEMYLAVNLEKQMSKDEILEAYLNLIPLGGKAYGVEAAANQYFSKSVQDLSLLECAFIAGVTQSPSSYYASAYSYATGKTAKNVTPRFVTRTIMVLDKMLDNNKISKAERDAAVNDLKNGKLIFKFSEKSTDKLNYEWFSLPVVYSVKQDLMKKYNLTEEEATSQLMTGGLKIYSTMDRNIQDAAQKIINDPKSYNGAGNPDSNGIIQPQGAAVIMDYHTGEVKCIIGGRGEQPPKSYNRAAYNGFSAYYKPVGSSIKPLTVYSPAIDTKKATAGTVMENSPLSLELQKLYGNGGLYNPKNDDGKYTGYETMRYALAFSHNVPAVKFANLVGVSTSKEYAEKYGLPSDQIIGIAAAALGELPTGTNPITMAAAYGVFGNNGIYTSARLYTKVTDSSGKVLLEGPTQDSHQVISPQAAYIMWDLLHGPIKVPGGTAYGISIGGMPISGKTGTSSDKKNVWFCGLSPYLSGAVWIGNDKPAVLSRKTGSSTAAHVWAAIMKEASKGQTIKDIKMPSGIVRVSICKDSGKLPTDNCKNDPRGSRVYSELFIEGTQPTSLCDTHVSLKINKDNNKLATEYTPLDKVIDKVFITRSYVPKVTLADQKYVAPTELDDTAPPIDTSISVNGIVLDRNDAVIKENDFIILTATISPLNATNQNVTWESSDQNVALVDNTGKVTGISKGTAVITVTTDDGAFTATCNIKVK